MRYNVAYALNEVRDEYILEAAVPQKVFVYWMLPVAASLCLLAGALGLYFMDGGRLPVSLELPIVNATESNPQPAVSTDVTTHETAAPAPTGATIWGNSGHMDTASFQTVNDGETLLCECLTQAMDASSDPLDVFAVETIGFSGMKRLNDAIVYQEFVLPLGVEEDFMENRVVFLTLEQIINLKCPENMGIAMHLAVLPNVMLSSNGKILVSESYFRELGEESMTLLLEFDNSYEVDCKREERPECGFEVNKAAFLKDYELSEGNCEYWLHYPSHIVILKDVKMETVYMLLEDPRIESLLHIRGGEGHFGIG